MSESHETARDLASNLAERARALVVRDLQYQEMMYGGVPVSGAVTNDLQKRYRELREIAYMLGQLEAFDTAISRREEYVPAGLLPFWRDVFP